MKQTENNFAYIDGANLYKGVESSAWKLDYRRFRSWVRQKFGITEAYLFIGLISKHADLYTSLQFSRTDRKMLNFVKADGGANYLS